MYTRRREFGYMKPQFHIVYTQKQYRISQNLYASNIFRKIQFLIQCTLWFIWTSNISISAFRNYIFVPSVVYTVVRTIHNSTLPQNHPIFWTKIVSNSCQIVLSNWNMVEVARVSLHFSRSEAKQKRFTLFQVSWSIFREKVRTSESLIHLLQIRTKRIYI